MLTVETSKHNFLFTVFLFTTPSFAAIGLSRQTVSHHLLIKIKVICLEVICTKSNITYCSSKEGQIASGFNQTARQRNTEMRTLHLPKIYF